MAKFVSELIGELIPFSVSYVKLDMVRLTLRDSELRSRGHILRWRCKYVNFALGALFQMPINM